MTIGVPYGPPAWPPPVTPPLHALVLHALNPSLKICCAAAGVAQAAHAASRTTVHSLENPDIPISRAWRRRRILHGGRSVPEPVFSAGDDRGTRACARP